jgi:hypothetical protein
MAFLNCRATGLFVDKGFVDQNKIMTRTLTHPIPMYNIDGTWNEAGSICEVVDVILCYKDHSERVQFAVTGLGKQDTILGYTWLKEHNPEVNWITKEVKMSRCPGRCSTCRTEIKQECHQHQMEACHLCSCWTGSMPTVEEIFEDLSPERAQMTTVRMILHETLDKSDTDRTSDRSDKIKPGDWIFMTTVYNPVEFIRASSTTSQCLSEAFAKNSAVHKTFHESVPPAFHDFEDVFSKVSFDVLPDCKP